MKHELPLEILNSLTSGVLAVDLENRILFLNRAMARRLAVNPPEWKGRHAAELLGLVTPHLAAAQDETSLRLAWPRDPKAKLSQEIEWRIGEQPLHLREDSAPLRDGAGHVIGRIFFYHDISREKSIDRMKSEFIAVASHELRTPMTSIKGSVDLILSGFAGDITADTQELLEIAQKSCDRLVRLINDILDLAKIESGQVKLHRLPLDLTDVVERSIRGVKALADQGQVALRIERAPNLPLVEVDKDRMEQVVTNLLSNAIKFAPANSPVSVDLRAEDGWVQCSVIDEGPGIAEADLPKVFGKFQQVGTKKKGGTGLGLAITQALVHEHHGKIWVESQENHGTRFIVRLPALPR
ncbi:MAG: sensor histidine kinase [Candidatus Acidiferrales bacterium]